MVVLVPHQINHVSFDKIVYFTNNIVTCYGKIDHLQFFIKTEFLAWIDSPMCAESNGASFMKKY